MSLPGLDAALSEAAARSVLSGGETPFAAMTVAAQLAQGVATLTRGEVAAPSGAIALAGAVDLPGATADLHVSLRPALPDPPTLGLRLTGPIAAPARTPELAGLALWHTAHDAVPP